MSKIRSTIIRGIVAAVGAVAILALLALISALQLGGL